MKFAHIADTHLGYRQYDLEEREQDFYNAWHQVIDKIIDERVDFVIHSGDLFDRIIPSPRAIIEAKKGFSKLNEKNITTYIIPGNHDIPKTRGSTNIPPTFIYDDKVKIITRENKFQNINETFIGGIPYYSGNYSNIIKEELSYFKREGSNYKKRILIMHQGIKKYIPFEGSYELEIDDLPDNFQYIAEGGIHKRIIDKYGAGYIVYPGSTETCNMTEYDGPNKKGFCLVDISGDEPIVEEINIETREFIKKDIKIGELDNTLQEIKNLAKNKPVVCLKIFGKEFDPNIVTRKIYSELEKVALFIRRPDFVMEDEKINMEIGEDINFEGIIKEYMNRQNFKNDEIDFAIGLYKHLNNGDLDEAFVLTDNYYKRR